MRERSSSSKNHSDLVRRSLMFKEEYEKLRN